MVVSYNGIPIVIFYYYTAGKESVPVRDKNNFDLTTYKGRLYQIIVCNVRRFVCLEYRKGIL